MRRTLIVAVLILIIGAVWLWWNRPIRADMAAYAPADSLIYIESNSLADAAQSIISTDAWRLLAGHAGTGIGGDQRLRTFAAWTGLAPTQTVILSRAQAAFVMLNLSTFESGETLKIRPQAALVIETHTSQGRIRPTIEALVNDFAQRAYGQPRVERSRIDDSEFVKWSTALNDRQIVLVIDKSVAIIGNDENSVRACLAVRRGQRPSLLDNPDLQQMRGRLKAIDALAFGYVSSANAAKLLSVGAPLFLGRSPDELQLQRLIATAASNILGKIGWSALPFPGGIEDRYLFALNPSIVSQLTTAFRPADDPKEVWDLVPAATHSITIYRYADPAAAWSSFNSAVSAHLDTLSSVLFTALLKSALARYGIDEPARFLPATRHPLLTVKLDEQSERSLLIARVGDEQTLRRLIGNRIGAYTERIGGEAFSKSADGSLAASFVGNYVMIGAPSDVKRCLVARARNETISDPNKFRQVTYFQAASQPASVVTFTDDAERIRKFLLTLAINAAKRKETMDAMARTVSTLPYSVTETSLGSEGIERRTRSSFGQLATLVSLLSPDT